ncbi:MAG: hypothetical protein F6K54_32340 [Okeania sp. SIO3B5]|uniref:hypothetical protein n=1 Tax=Okeania sp. SIO3B5 TaxID=2607811 RepID=UPI001401B8BC|nr:hypothetical protein [Okeania sp. SIO3B5]NEO57353.1 hypothetical protein [Okeania sp. SIO3B5]
MFTSCFPTQTTETVGGYTISQKLFYILLSRRPTPNPSGVEEVGEWGSGGVNPPLTLLVEGKQI